MGMMRQIGIWSRSLAAIVREILPDARRAAGKPWVAWHIVSRAYHAQFALVVAVCLLIFVAAPLVNTITSTLFPGTSSEKLFGLIKKSSQSPIKTFLDQFLMTAAWVGALGWVALLFWKSIPKGIAGAEARSDQLAKQAEELAETDRTRCLELYGNALRLSADAPRTKQLRARIAQLNSGPTPHLSKAVSADDAAATAIVSTAALGRVGPGGRFAIEAELGKGSMGEVYRGIDTVLNREVALKQLSFRLLNDEAFADRFRREAQALARLTHPNIVQVYDFVEEAGRLWMVLELVVGGDLAGYIESKGRIEFATAAAIAMHAAHGLAHAHAQGIVHRDLKPGNILLTKDRQPKISDFGIAKLNQSTKLTQMGSVLGSPRYMSPEQASGGEVDERTDIYALGITLYEMLTGQVPFDGDASSVLAKHIIDRPTPPRQLVPELPAEAEQVVLKLLAKRPEDRPADMIEVTRLLAPLAECAPGALAPRAS